jgi:putative transposase
MSRAIALKPLLVTSQLPAALNKDDVWQTATGNARAVAQYRFDLIRAGTSLVRDGASVNNVAALLHTRCKAGQLDAAQAAAVASLGEAPSVPTLKRWLAAFKRQGKEGLLPKHTGRVRKEYGWELRSIALYNLPSKPAMSGVALKLRKEGFDTATDSRVAGFLRALPATVGENSPDRIGKHLHRLRRQSYQPRDASTLQVGEVYAGDGHTADCYVAHPNTGKPYRPELTAFIDIRSRYIPGWYLSDSESAVSTLFALSHAMQTYDHVPAWLYLDHGAGYRSRLLNDETTGFYQRFSMKVIGALPGNPHGKGWIERWFRTVRDHHDKFFAGGLVYCGNDMAGEINRRLSSDIDAGKRKLPSLENYHASLAHFIEEYNNTPMETLEGKTPAEVWKGLQQVAVSLPAEAIIRPRERRTVQRQMVELHKRMYYHAALSLYDGKKLSVEYDLHKDSSVWIYDQNDRFVCMATLVSTIGVLPESRLEEQRGKRLQGQLKRLEKKVDEAHARANDAITIDDQLNGLEQNDLVMPALTPRRKSGIVIDILDN